jgi:hypothetical protein
VRGQQLRGALGGAAFALTAAALAAAPLWAAVPPAAALFLFTWSQLRLHEQFSGQRVKWRHAWLPALLPIVGGLVSASMRLDPTIDWRGRSYSLDEAARLARQQERATTTSTP